MQDADRLAAEQDAELQSMRDDLEQIQHQRRERQSKARSNGQATPNESDNWLTVVRIAREVVTEAKPLWHRDRKSIYFGALGKELELRIAWALPGDSAAIERIRDQCSNDKRMTCRSARTEYKEAVAVVLGHLVTELPEVLDADSDDAAVQREHESIRQALASVLSRARTIPRDLTERGWVHASYLGFAERVAPGSGWRQWHGRRVWCRRADEFATPEIASQGSQLATDMAVAGKNQTLDQLRRLDLISEKVWIRTENGTVSAFLIAPGLIREEVAGGDGNPSPDFVAQKGDKGDKSDAAIEKGDKGDKGDAETAFLPL